MLEFRNDTIKLSKKYPDILKVTVSKAARTAMCEELGNTEKHIEAKGGSMQFETLFVEPEDA